MIPKIAFLASLLVLSCACLSEAALDLNRSCVDSLGYEDRQKFIDMSHQICTHVNGLLFMRPVELYYEIESRTPERLANVTEYWRMHKRIIESKHPCTPDLLKILSERNASLSSKSLAELFTSYVQCGSTWFDNSLLFILNHSQVQVYRSKDRHVILSGEIDLMHPPKIIPPSNRTFFVEELKDLLNEIKLVLEKLNHEKGSRRLILQIPQLQQEDPLIRELTKHSLILDANFSAHLLETLFTYPDYKDGFIIIRFTPEQTTISAVTAFTLGIRDGFQPTWDSDKRRMRALTTFSNLTTSTIVDRFGRDKIFIARNGMYLKAWTYNFTDTILSVNTPHYFMDGVIKLNEPDFLEFEH